MSQKRTKVKIKEVKIGNEVRRLPTIPLDETILKENIGDRLIELGDYEDRYYELLEKCREAKKMMNKDLVKTYWKIGGLLNQFQLECEEFSIDVVRFIDRLSTDLEIDSSTLYKCMMFRNTYPNFKKINPKWKWSQIRRLLHLTEKVRKSFEKEINKGKIIGIKELEGKIKEFKTKKSKKTNNQ